MRIGVISVVGIILVVIGGHFGGGDHFDGGDYFGGGTEPAAHIQQKLTQVPPPPPPRSLYEHVYLKLAYPMGSLTSLSASITLSLARLNNNDNDNDNNNKQVLDEVFEISGIIKVKESVNSRAEG